MAIHPLAGKPAPQDMLTNIPRLVSAYYIHHPEANDPLQAVSFGTSGHRGSSLKKTLNEDHVHAITQAICEYRKQQKIDGPLFLGKDTHALSEPSVAGAIEVLAANEVEALIQADDGYTPTPVISHAIINWNRGRTRGKADGIVITPSHNPPEDGGFKYNPPEGGPADTAVTKWIQDRANVLLAGGNRDVRKMVYEKAIAASTIRTIDYIIPYVMDLDKILDMEAIRRSGIRIGVDPMGGSGIAFWEPIAEIYSLNIEVVNRIVDPAFGFMTVDRDGKIRMDCSSPYAMARLVEMKDRFNIAFGNDPDYDRHGIVTPDGGLMNPNHYLAVAIHYLFSNRKEWKQDMAVGKTLVSSAMIDRVAADLKRKLFEVPVGFKWFVDGLLNGSCGFGGEESAGAAFLRKDGTVWTTDKDGIIMDLLAAEITAVTGENPYKHYRKLTERFGEPDYERMDVALKPGQKDAFKNLTPDSIKAATLAGEEITSILTKAPGNGAAIGGLKVTTANGWFAARPSGTEDIYKIYTESFRDRDHLRRIQEEAQAIVRKALGD